MGTSDMEKAENRFEEAVDTISREFTAQIYPQILDKGYEQMLSDYKRFLSGVIVGILGGFLAGLVLKFFDVLELSVDAWLLIFIILIVSLIVNIWMPFSKWLRRFVMGRLMKNEKLKEEMISIVKKRMRQMIDERLVEASSLPKSEMKGPRDKNN